MQIPSTLPEFEAHTLANASHFTAFLRNGPNVRVKVEAIPTREAAIQAAHALAAEHGRNALVYAVTAAGRSVMVGHVTPAGVFH